MKYLLLAILAGFMAGCASEPPRQCYLQTERGTCYGNELVGQVHFMDGITHEVCCPLPKHEPMEHGMGVRR
jgi:hypothetical protein